MHHSDVAKEAREPSLVAMIAAGLGALVIPVLVLIWIANPSDPEALLYALIIANALPLLWNVTRPVDPQARKSSELTQLLVHAALFLGPYVVARAVHVPMPEGAAWTTVGFLACFLLGVTLVAQLAYRDKILTYVQGRRSRMTSKETTFPRL